MSARMGMRPVVMRCDVGSIGGLRSAAVGTDLAAHETGQDHGRLLGPLRHINVWVGVIADKHVGELHHPGRDVGVQIEGGDNWHIRTDDISHGLQNVPLSVIVGLGNHRAV
jgi:hypothetical protein